MKNLSYLFLAIVLVLGFTQCSESEFEEGAELDTSYVQLALGNEWVYQVDSLTISRGGDIVNTSTSQVKEVISKELKNEDGLKIYQVSRFYRQTENDEWRERDQWQLGLEGSVAFRVANNIKEVKLTFPVREKNTWNANVYVDKQRELSIGGNTYKYYENWQPEIVSTDAVYEKFSNVAEVKLVDIDNVFVYQQGEEKYAKGVGLVYSDVHYLRVIASEADPRSWDEGKADIGFRITHKLLSHKVN